MREGLISVIQKEAGWKQTAALATFNVGVVVGMTKFIDKMDEYFTKKRVRKEKPAFYAKMMQAHPELLKEDPKLVAKYWASLYHFAPYMAQDALASGSFIRQSIARGLPSEFGGPAPDTYLMLTDIQTKQMKKNKEISLMGEVIKKEMPNIMKGLFGTSGGPKVQDNNPAG